MSKPVADLSLFPHFFSLQSAGQDAVGGGGAPRAFAAGEFAHDYSSNEDVKKESRRNKATLPCGGAPRACAASFSDTLGAQALGAPSAWGGGSRWAAGVSLTL